MLHNSTPPKASTHARRPRLVPQPLPHVMSSAMYTERLRVLVHTNLCRPREPWVKEEDTRPELVWEPAPSCPYSRSSSPTITAGAHMVARIKTVAGQSLSMGRGDDSSTTLPRWRTPSPSQSCVTPTRAMKNTDLAEAEGVIGVTPTASPNVFIISDDDDDVEVSQLRLSASRSSAQATTLSPPPRRQLQLHFSPPAPTVRISREEAAADPRTPLAVGNVSDKRRDRRVSDSSHTPHTQKRASSGGSSVLVLSAMPPTKKTKTAPVPPRSSQADGDAPLPRTIEEFLQTDY